MSPDRPRRLVVAIGVSVMVAAAGLTGTPPSPSAAAPDQASGLLRLVAHSPAVEPGGTFRLQLRVTGAPPDAELEITIRNRVLNRIQYLGTIDGERMRSRLDTVRVALDEVPPDAAGTVVVDLQTASNATGPTAVRLSTPGVYPVVVSLEDGEGAPLTDFVTHLVRLPTPDPSHPPLDVAIVVPVHAPPGQQPDGSVRIDGLARAELVTVASALQRFPAVPLTVTPTPEILDALGADPGSQDFGLLESIRRGVPGRQVLSGPYVELDASAWIQSETPAVLSQEFDQGLATVVNRLDTVDPTSHLGDPTLDTATATWLRDRGITTLVIPESALEPLDTDEFPVTLTQRFLLAGVDGTAGVVADESLAGHVGESGDPILDAHHLLADLAVLYFDEPPARRAAVTALPTDELLDPALLEALLGGISAVSVLRPVPVATVFAEVPLAGSAGETDGSGAPLARNLRPAVATDLGTLPQRLAGAQADVTSFAATVESTTPPQPDDLSRLLLVTPSADLSVADQDAYLRGVRTTMNAELAHVDLPTRQTFTLTAREGVVPIAVHNSAGYPMTVLLRLSGERLEFPQNPDGQLRLDLVGEITRVEVTVRTLTSGDSPLTLSVSTADGRQELDRSRFTIRSTAVSGVGLALIGGAVLFLAGWWGRNIHRARRNRRLVPAPSAD